MKMNRVPIKIEFPDSSFKLIKGIFLNGELITDEKIEQKEYKMYLLDETLSLVEIKINKK